MGRLEEVTVKSEEFSVLIQMLKLNGLGMKGGNFPVELSSLETTFMLEGDTSTRRARLKPQGLCSYKRNQWAPNYMLCMEDRFGSRNRLKF